MGAETKVAERSFCATLSDTRVAWLQRLHGTGDNPAVTTGGLRPSMNTMEGPSAIQHIPDRASLVIPDKVFPFVQVPRALDAFPRNKYQRQLCPDMTAACQAHKENKFLDQKTPNFILLCSFLSKTKT